MKLLEQKELHVALKAITKSVTVTRQRVQDVAVQAVAYSIVHGDISIGNMLLEAVGVNKSLRRDSLVAYLEKFGNFAWMKSDKKLAFFPAHTVGKLEPAHEALILGAKWDEAKREAEVISKYDMETQVRLFITKMHKIAGDAANTVENRDALTIIEQSFMKWSAENTLRNMKVDPKLEEEGEKAEAIAKARAEAEAKAQADAEAAKQMPLPTIEPGLVAVAA